EILHSARRLVEPVLSLRRILNDKCLKHPRLTEPAQRVFAGMCLSGIDILSGKTVFYPRSVAA
ncbi:MAG TPA: hypothetical protein PKH07_18655, partial [bacterium]|nr:hypothetical protein [bacterium]